MHMTGIWGTDVVLWDILCCTVVAMPLLWYLYRADRMFRMDSDWNIKRLLQLAGVGAAASILFRVILEQFGMPGYESVEQNLLTENRGLQAIVLLGASPVLEEFFFRGVLYEKVKRVIGIKRGMILTALLFGLYHANISQGIYGFFMGLYLAWCMEHYQTVKAPIAVHIAANMAAICMDWLLY